MPICDVKFVGCSTYKEWAWLMSSLLDGLGLLGHVTGDSPKPTVADQVLLWMKDEARVKYVLLQSTKFAVRMSFCGLTSSKEIWTFLEKRYCQTSHALRFSLLQQLSTIKQDDSSVEEFYSKLCVIWHQLDLMTPSYPSEISLLYKE